MDYYLIKGHFHVVGYSPDGDSLMFEASNKKNWQKVVSANSELFEQKLKDGKGVVQLRLQAIDALETHYSPTPVPPPKGMNGKKSSKAIAPKKGKFRQPEKYGEMATAKMMEMFGVENMVWGRSGWGGSYVKQVEVKKGKRTSTYKSKNKNGLEGFIVVNDIERKGRPISWVFPGKIRIRDGAKLTTTKLNGILKKSANYKLVANGLVYPYFFFTLEAKLRDTIMHAVNNARRQKMNIWSEDKTDVGVTMKKTSQVTGEHLIFPYLFRRLIKHQYRRMMEGYWVALKKKKSYKPKVESLFLDSFYDDTNPYIFMIKEKEFKRLDEIVSVTKNKIKMNTDPGNIVFLS